MFSVTPPSCYSSAFAASSTRVSSLEVELSTVPDATLENQLNGLAKDAFHASPQIPSLCADTGSFEGVSRAIRAISVDAAKLHLDIMENLRTSIPALMPSLGLQGSLPNSGGRDATFMAEPDQPELMQNFKQRLREQIEELDEIGERMRQVSDSLEVERDRLDGEMREIVTLCRPLLDQSRRRTKNMGDLVDQMTVATPGSSQDAQSDVKGRSGNDEPEMGVVHSLQPGNEGLGQRPLRQRRFLPRWVVRLLSFMCVKSPRQE